METCKPPTGRDIWNAIKEELTNNFYPLPFNTLALTRYHVYLHPEDYQAIEGIVPRIVSEVARALTAEVQRINRKESRRGGRLWTALRHVDQLPPVEIPPGGWEIYIQPDHDGELPRGALGLVSKLTMPSPPEYVGTPTTRIVKTVVAEGRRTTTTSEEQESSVVSHQSSVVSGQSSVAGPRFDAPLSSQSLTEPAPSGHSPVAPTGRPASDVGRATLIYEDEEGPHLFIVKKDCIKVGRGGMGAWVDVQVMTNPRVSREHCWIHCDPSGRFFIQDVSTWGTSVNGAPIPAAVRSAEGAVIEAGASQPLPTGSRIGLADALVMQFEARSYP
jgi:pSer/pThr/pTyr-binding forkhead associated (FHA) protein